MTRLAVSGRTATTIVVEGRELTYFGGCDYLGLAQHPALAAAARAGLEQFGLSSGAARETTGNTRAHDELEEQLARRLEVGQVVLLADGALANLAAAQALSADHDLVLLDEAAHPSLADAARAAGLATRTFAHADLDRLREACSREAGRRIVVATDSVFPARGAIAPLAELARCAADVRATLWLDDAHGTGVIGARGLGALEFAQLARQRVVLTSTLSKSLGCCGGFVAAETQLCERLRGSSQAYLGTTPIPPALACAASVALELAFDDVERVGRLRANAAVMRAGLERLHLAVPRDELPVFAFALASRAAMDELHAHIVREGMLVPLVHYAGMPAAGMFRLAVTAAHSLAELERLLDALRAGLGGRA